MKKLVLVLLGLFCLVACGNYNELHTGPNGEVRTTGEVMFQRQIRFYNVYHDGNWHEYVVNDGFYAGGMDHWPDCKFCKEKNKEK